MRMFAAAALAATTVSAAPAAADFARIQNESQFREVVQGRTLAYPLVRLRVTPDGRIVGRGAGREVSGQWQWQDGLFCRDLYWGERELGYNCQTVEVRGNTVRFTSDAGEGDHADFRLR
jgi:hypothetical protein